MSSAANHKSLLTGIMTNPIIVSIGTGRELNPYEESLANLIFKNGVNYKEVKIIRGGLKGLTDATGNAMTPWGNIHLPSKDYDRIDNFALADATDKIWFIHEMAHVWQYKQGMSTATKGLINLMRGGYHKSKAYRYDLRGKDKGKTFPEFNFEQQADIISHYFDAVYLSDVNHDAPNLHQTNLAQYKELAEVLHSFLNNPNNPQLISQVYGNF